MKQWRPLVLLIVSAIPVLVLLGLGGLWLWQHPDIGFYLWWPLAACWAVAVILAWWWQRQQRLLPPPAEQPQLHWTPRDREAWELVKKRALGVKDMAPEQLMRLQCYVDTAEEMAMELARFYHPKAKDPIGSLTIPEILAVIELAAQDLSQMVDDYIPGSHLLTIDHWRRAAEISKWYNAASLGYWAVSALFNPVRTLTRFAATRIGLSQPFQLLKENVLAWFYVAFVHRVGTYLIEVYSGRLKVGVRRYRELMAQTTTELSPPVGDNGPTEVTITVLGQVKAGKSSLINAIFSDQQAAVDVVPTTSEISRYQLQPPGVADRFVLLDTVGYGHGGPDADQLDRTCQAAQQSDLLLLVVNARDPARDADAALLRQLAEWFRTRAELKMPPVVAVVTHIDLLPPAIEWSPPYDWRHPNSVKEKNIAEAVAVVREQLGDLVREVVPVCTAEGKVFGVHEYLLPRILDLLGEARAVAVLRCLHAEASGDRVRRLLKQMLHGGQQLWRIATSGPDGG